jgi:PncC family amidohydrolase
MSDKIRSTEIGHYVFAESTSDDESSEVLVRRVIEMLRERGLTVGTAESCTAGMIASKIGDIPGCSDVLYGGIVSYANEIKMGVLSVPEKIIKKHGAVSEECARYMAEGARRVLGCDVAVSVTGIAGPGGGTPEKPVGTVCFGVSDKFGTVTSTERFGSMKDRGKIRRLTTSAALMKIVKRLQENSF